MVVVIWKLPEVTRVGAREEIIRLICSAGYRYTLVRDCALGFISNCLLGYRPPLVITHDLEGLLKPGVDALIADSYEDPPRVINKLLSSDSLYERLQHRGHAKYKEN